MHFPYRQQNIRKLPLVPRRDNEATVRALHRLIKLKSAASVQFHPPKDVGELLIDRRMGSLFDYHDLAVLDRDGLRQNRQHVGHLEQAGGKVEIHDLGVWSR